MRHYALQATLSDDNTVALGIAEYGSLIVSKVYIQFCVDRWSSSRAEVFCKKVFLKISQNSQENTCAGVSYVSGLS